MKKILLATDSYHYAPTANGICVEEIAMEFLKKGNIVHVLCYQHGNETECEEIHGVMVHRIKMDWVNTLRFYYEKKFRGWKQVVFRNLMILLNRIEAVMFMPWYPMRSPLFCFRYAHKMKQLKKKYGYDLIVASYWPFEAAYSLWKLDKIDKPKTCLYTLDSLTNHGKKLFLTSEFQDKKGWTWEEKIYSNCDLILNMKCHESHYAQERYKKYYNKMKIVDIPHMINIEDAKRAQLEEMPNKGNNPKIAFYAGVIRKEMMPYVIDILGPYLRQGILVWNIYGRNEEKYINQIKIENKIDNINQHGFIEHEKILELERKADILVSMGNTASDFIPSKIFEYMATGRKILHIYDDEKDSALPYYKKYPNSLCISIHGDKKKNREQVEKFISGAAEKIDFQQLGEIFYMNTPLYTVQMIMDIFKPEEK